MKIKSETIVRSIILFATMIVAILIHFELITADAIIEDVTLAASAVSAVWAWWKNNSFTDEAISADNYLSMLKSPVVGFDAEGNPTTDPGKVAVEARNPLGFEIYKETADDEDVKEE